MPLGSVLSQRSGPIRRFARRQYAWRLHHRRLAFGTRIWASRRMRLSAECRFCPIIHVGRQASEDMRPSMGPAAYDAIPLATSAMVMCKDSPGDLKTSWLSLLVPDGILVASKKEGVELMTYTLGSTVHGALGWRCTGHRVGSQAVIVQLRSSSTSNECAWRHILVTKSNLDDWVCTGLEVVSPAFGPCRWPDGAIEKGIHLLVDKSPRTSLLRFAAATGFRTLTVALMKKLYKLLAVPHKGAMPSTEMTVAFALVRHCMPEKTPDEVKAIVGRRFSSRPPPIEATITAEDLPMVVKDFGEEDEKAVKNDLKLIEKLKGGGASTVPAKTGRAMPAKPVQKDLIVEGQLSSEHARQYLPDVRGCTIHKDVRLHMRWCATYPKKLPPRSATNAFGVMGDREAMMYCLRWVWQEHTAATAEECPYNLE